MNEEYGKCKTKMKGTQMELIIENGTLEVKDSEQEGNVELEKVRIPASVTKIGTSAFKGCANLKEVEFEDGPKPLEIGEGAFEGCKALREINLPGRASRFLRACFKNSGLERLSIGRNGDFIASQVPEKFAGCPEEKTLDEVLEQERLRRVEKLYGAGRWTVFQSGRRDMIAEPDKSLVSLCSTKEEFEKFWSEFMEWWVVEGEEEDVSLKRGKTVYTLRCRWSERTVLVGMVSPWGGEWDYAQLYCGMFGWGDDDDEGFGSKATRKKVVRLLLDEIIKRNKWMQTHPGSYREREDAIAADLATSEETIRRIREDLDALAKRKDSMSEESFNKEKAALDERLSAEENDRTQILKPWFARYRWTRGKAAGIGEGDLRLYVKGVNHLWGAKVQCEWALADLRNG